MREKSTSPAPLSPLTEREKAQVAELGRLRNRHVGKLLTYLTYLAGEDTIPEYIEDAIKVELSQFEKDVKAQVLGLRGVPIGYTPSVVDNPPVELSR